MFARSTVRIISLVRLMAVSALWSCSARSVVVLGSAAEADWIVVAIFGGVVEFVTLGALSWTVYKGRNAVAC